MRNLLRRLFDRPPRSFDLVIKVNAIDIATGKRANSTECPVALALARALALRFQRTDIIAEAGSVNLWADAKGFGRYKAMMPEPARGFIVNFDVRMDLDPVPEPITFAVLFKRH